MALQVLDAGIASLASKLREQVGFQRWIGVGVILGGVVMIGLS